MTDAIERGRPVKRHASGSPRPVVQPWEPAEAVLKRIRKIVESSLSGPVGPYQALEEIDDVLKGNYILDSRNREEARRAETKGIDSVDTHGSVHDGPTAQPGRPKGGSQ